MNISNMNDLFPLYNQNMPLSAFVEIYIPLDYT